MTLNKLFSEGDLIINMMKKEVDTAPFMARNDMLNRWQLVFKDWNSFKQSIKQSTVSIGMSNTDQVLNRGISILERTGDSLARAESVARESEQIGTAVITELGEQRESLVRTRDRLDGTNQELKRASRILSSINRRVLTNKCLLIFIIIFEIAILLGVIYYRIFVKKH